MSFPRLIYHLKLLFPTGQRSSTMTMAKDRRKLCIGISTHNSEGNEYFIVLQVLLNLSRYLDCTILSIYQTSREY